MSTTTHTSPTTVTVLGVRRGIAGQISASTLVEYDGDDFPTLVDFVGSVYGGPVTLVFESGMQATISDAVRARVDAGGVFAVDPSSWVTRFYA